ncbi:hypothetical protein M135_2300 [Bacteroides fragilis str. S36L5]|nr:hypothetical protein M135_2300 [Bacteroides fragilis str. S36L5]
MLEPKEFEQGIEYALANDCDGLQIDTWNIDDDAVMDFKLFEYLQPIITQYFIDNKSEIWLLFLIAHSKR